MLWSNRDVFSGKTTFTTKFLDQDFGSAYCLAGISIYHELPGDRLNGLCSRVQAFRLWFAWLCHPLVWYLKRLRSWPTVRNNWVENQGRSRLSCQSLHVFEIVCIERPPFFFTYMLMSVWENSTSSWIANPWIWGFHNIGPHSGGGICFCLSVALLQQFAAIVGFQPTMVCFLFLFFWICESRIFWWLLFFFFWISESSITWGRHCGGPSWIILTPVAMVD